MIGQRFLRTAVSIAVIWVAAAAGANAAPPAIAAAAASANAAPPPAGLRTGPASAAGNWPAYNRTVAGDRFSPLAQITRSNVARLKLVCAYTLPEAGAFQTGPIVVGGTMYFTTDEDSYAIDAGSCRQKWTRHRHSTMPNPLHVNRGFAYLDARLYRGTSDAHVIALDARDGHVLWRLDVVPSGHARESWTNSDLPITGGAFWTSFTLDRSKGILYVPAGNPAPDFDVLDRTGTDLYTDSIIAVDAATGRMIGYNQLVARDTHDWDVDSPPTLATTRSGREIIASANKDGLLSILDRTGVGLSTPVPSGGGVPVIPLLSQTPTTTRTNVDPVSEAKGWVTAFDAESGAVRWRLRAPHPMVAAVASGMHSTLWPGAADKSRILVYGLP